MSWLKDQQAKVEAEKAAKDKEAAKEKEQWEYRNERNKQRAIQEHKHKFADLESKYCYQETDGYRKNLGKFHSEVKDASIDFFAGETKLGSVHYSMQAGTEYDSDGCGWSTDEYHETSEMWFYLPYIKKDGTKAELNTSTFHTRTSYFGIATDERLGEYLLNFVKL